MANTAEPGNTEPAGILMVEPDATLARTACALLESAGHLAAHVQDSTEALALAARLFPNVLILDIGEPRPETLKFLHRVRTLGPGRTLFVIATSAYPISRNTLRSHGIDALVQKPYDMRHLLGTVRNALGPLLGMPHQEG